MSASCEQNQGPDQQPLTRTLLIGSLLGHFLLLPLLLQQHLLWSLCSPWRLWPYKHGRPVELVSLMQPD